MASGTKREGVRKSRRLAQRRERQREDEEEEHFARNPTARTEAALKEFRRIMLPFLDGYLSDIQYWDADDEEKRQRRQRISEQEGLQGARGRAPFPPTNPYVARNEAIRAANENEWGRCHRIRATGLYNSQPVPPTSVAWSPLLDIHTGEPVVGWPVERDDLDNLTWTESSRILKAIGVYEETESAEGMHKLIRMWST